MKKFVKIIGSLTGVGFIAIGIYLFIIASDEAKYSHNPIALYIIMGVAMLLAGIFWLGLMGWLSSLEKRMEEMGTKVVGLKIDIKDLEKRK